MFRNEGNSHEALRRAPLFAALDKHELDRVAQVSRELDVGICEELIHEHKPGKQFFVLLDGEAEVLRNGQEVNRLGPGDFFGEISLLSDRPTTAAVVTTTPARVVTIAPADFRRLLEEMPILQMRVIQALADRLPDEFYTQV